jgi:hypothetical protein
MAANEYTWCCAFIQTEESTMSWLYENMQISISKSYDIHNSGIHSGWIFGQFIRGGFIKYLHDNIETNSSQYETSINTMTTTYITRLKLLQSDMATPAGIVNIQILEKRKHATAAIAQHASTIDNRM